MKALKASDARNEHQRRRSEYVDRSVDSIKNGYTAAQVPDVARAAVFERREKSIEAALRTWVDFHLGHSMLLRLNWLSRSIPRSVERSRGKAALRYVQRSILITVQFQIKNLMFTAHALATQEGARVGMSHLEVAIAASQDFERDFKGVGTVD